MILSKNSCLTTDSVFLNYLILTIISLKYNAKKIKELHNFYNRN